MSVCMETTSVPRWDVEERGIAEGGRTVTILSFGGAAEARARGSSRASPDGASTGYECPPGGRWAPRPSSVASSLRPASDGAWFWSATR